MNAAPLGQELTVVGRCFEALYCLHLQGEAVLEGLLLALGMQAPGHSLASKRTLHDHRCDSRKCFKKHNNLL